MSESGKPELPRYFDRDTGQHLHIYLGWHFAQVNGIEVELEGVPLLKNEITGEVVFTFKTAAMVNYFVGEAKKQGNPGIRLSPKPRESKRYGYCEKVDFIYSDIDYEHIPGLVRPWDEGFLTPVFFKSSVLNKYTQNPEYRLDLFSESYGNIESTEWIIAFGINRNSLIFMWLGDINSLPLQEQYYLRSENVDSDHEIHSEFYDAQIGCIPSEPSPQKQLLKARSGLDGLVKSQHNFHLYQLHGEVDKVIEHLHRPVFWEDRHVAPVVEALNKILVESLNISELKNRIKRKDEKANIKSLGSLKVLGVWLENYTRLGNIYEIMTPFYVLYDYRIVCAHLASEGSRLEKIKTVNERLGLDQNESNNETIYDALIGKLLSSIDAIANEIKS